MNDALSFNIIKSTASVDYLVPMANVSDNSYHLANAFNWKSNSSFPFAIKINRKLSSQCKNDELIYENTTLGKMALFIKKYIYQMVVEFPTKISVKEFKLKLKSSDENYKNLLVDTIKIKESTINETSLNFDFLFNKEKKMSSFHGRNVSISSFNFKLVIKTDIPNQEKLIFESDKFVIRNQLNSGGTVRKVNEFNIVVIETIRSKKSSVDNETERKQSGKKRKNENSIPSPKRPAIAIGVDDQLEVLEVPMLDDIDSITTDSKDFQNSFIQSSEDPFNMFTEDFISEVENHSAPQMTSSLMSNPNLMCSIITKVSMIGDLHWKSKNFNQFIFIDVKRQIKIKNEKKSSYELLDIESKRGGDTITPLFFKSTNYELTVHLPEDLIYKSSTLSIKRLDILKQKKDVVKDNVLTISFRIQKFKNDLQKFNFKLDIDTENEKYGKIKLRSTSLFIDKK